MVETARLLAPATRMGPVHLTVADLERSVAFYTWAIGIEVLRRGEGVAALGVDEELVVLVEERGAEPAHRHTGLFHVALRVPDRPSLARWLAHVARERIPLEGLSDHRVSEAIYLRDPDHHGLEVYADRPRALWEDRVSERMTTAPLDVRNLLGELEGEEDGLFEGLTWGTRVGHVHLQVADVDRAVAFYCDVVGFELVARIPQAAFVSAGGYHHHVGLNTWRSLGASPPPAGSAALRHATILLSDEADLERVAARAGASGLVPEDGTPHELRLRDPSGSALVFARDTSARDPVRAGESSQ